MSIAENFWGHYQNLALLRQTNGLVETNFFKALNFDYYYIDNGHDLATLIDTFTHFKDTTQPTVIHMRTFKGKGYEPAESNKETFHYTSPFDIKTLAKLWTPSKESYTQLTDEFLCKKAALDSKIVAITAATPSSVGLDQFRYQFMDVGIAEVHAIALASRIASQGGKPVASFFSS